ncbi:hypothetical protein ABE571_07185 [Stenotrophomonas sp. TWI273]|uniref:hypothetical protein n=1 Tax=Stenotrophomonas sp. TWI273 TaxID=3136774 RepID=UPI003209C030
MRIEVVAETPVTGVCSSVAYPYVFFSPSVSGGEDEGDFDDEDEDYEDGDDEDGDEPLDEVDPEDLEGWEHNILRWNEG